MEKSLLFQALIFLSAAVLLVPLAKKWGLGSVLGYLIAGIVIGPALFGFIGDNTQDIMHFAEFGVVMMLFVIGLELEPSLLWRMRKAILGMGGVQVMVTGLFIALVTMQFDFSWQESVAIGFTLALSSTAIVLQTLQEKGLMKTSAGQSAFSVLLFQDIAVIPMLALFPLLATLPVAVDPEAHSTNLIENLSAWVQTAIVIAAIVSVILAGRYIIPPIFRLVASSRIRELFTAVALLVVIAISVLMSLVGLSPALGTFLAGVVLANSEYRHELESDIEPFKGLLLGLFFIAVGASIDFNLLVEKPVLILGIVAGLIALKSIVLWVIGKVFRLKTDQNMLFAVSLSQMGEFGFVLFTFSNKNGILDQGTVDILIAVTAISMALAPIMFLIHEKFVQPRIGTKMVVEEKEHDHIDESNPVIVAGFGHFGNTVGRFLKAHGVGTTFLDIDSDRVDLLRKMGFKVYYGDASRHDLLKAAGAEKAKLIIVALDSPEKRMEIVEVVKKHFPNLRILARATNRVDAYDLMNAGILNIYRETLDASLRMGVDAMHFLGFRKYAAKRAARTFFEYDEKNLKYLSSLKLNSSEYISTAKKYIEELESLIQSDLHNESLHGADEGWSEEGLIKEFGSPKTEKKD